MDAISKSFDAMVVAMYNTVVPVAGYDLVEHSDIDFAMHYLRTGMVPVVEHTDDPIPVCAELETYYKMCAWLNYRYICISMHDGNMFQDVVSDLINNYAWSAEVPEWITMIDGIVNVQAEYDDKFGHLPVDLTKFIKSYMKHGRGSVLRADIY